MVWFKKNNPGKTESDVPDQAAPVDEEFSISRPQHLAAGPFDVVDKPEASYIDLGGLLIPVVPGLELRMEQDPDTGIVTSANLVVSGSALQIQAFAAPKTEGIWAEVRGVLRDGIISQGGTAEKTTGVFGDELLVRLPFQRGDGKLGFRSARFVGIDGPRWFLRAVISGPALTDTEHQEFMENLLSRVVVVRGDHAMPPQELIPLRLPEQEEVFLKEDETEFNPLETGPSIAEVR